MTTHSSVNEPPLHSSPNPASQDSILDPGKANEELARIGIDLETLTKTTNLYQFGIEAVDRERLVAQTGLWATRLLLNAPRFVRTKPVKRILDIGCGTGQLTLLLGRIYPDAEVVGIDSNSAYIDQAQKLKQKAVPKPAENVNFVVGDITQGLPDGPFDLIHGSVVLLYIKDPVTVLKNAYDILSPGGTIWLKELRDSVEAPTIHHEAYKTYISHAMEAFSKIGASNDIGTRLPQLLADIGFTEIRKEEETYPVTYATMEGNITISCVLGGMYNAHKMVAQMLNVPSSEILKLHSQLVKDIPRLRGKWVLPITLGRKPVDAS